MKIITTSYQDFFFNEKFRKSFYSILNDFHSYLVHIEGAGLMKIVQDYGKWYSEELLKDAKKSSPIPTKMVYICKGE